MKRKVVITDFVTEPLDREREILGDIADVVAIGAEDEAGLIGAIEDADAVMMYHFLSVGKATIDRLEKCQLIVRCGVGVDNVDGAAARARGIPVANVPDYGTEDVADSAVGSAVFLARGTHFLNSRLRRGEGAWTYEQATPVPRLRGRTFGIVGLGRIGIAAALRAKAFGFDVVVHDPTMPDGRERSLGVRRLESLTELLGASDVVSLHCPLTDETRHLIDADAIASMRDGSILVNTARGGVVDRAAALGGIESGKLSGVALDVLETEPPAPDDLLVAAWRNPAHPAHDRLVLTPHSAFYTDEGLIDMRVKGAENCRRVLLGEAPRNVTND